MENTNEEINWNEEFEKCKDPVYFYENYLLIDGKKPNRLSEADKEYMRKYSELGNKLNENKKTS